MHAMIRIGVSAIALAVVAHAHAQQSNPETSQPSAQPPAAQESQRQTPPAGSGPESVPAKGAPDSPPQHQVIGPPNAGPVPLRGDGLDLPGATAQTAPAKFSQENAERAKLAIMQTPVQLTDEQRQSILHMVGKERETNGASGPDFHAEVGVFLPPLVAAQDFPKGLAEQIPALRGLKYVKAGDEIVLVAPANNIVRGVLDE